MKNLFKSNEYRNRGCDRESGVRRSGYKFAVAAILCFALSAVVMQFSVQAQRGQLNVTNISTSAAAGGTTVSIVANGSLGKAQTWHDSEGYHVVIPNTVAADSLKTIRGLRVRRIGTSLEIVAHTKPGAAVNVLSFDNKLQLVIEGKLNSKFGDFDAPVVASSEEPGVYREPQYWVPPQSVPQGSFSSPVGNMASKPVTSNAETAHNSTNWNPQMGPQASSPPATPATQAADAALAPSEIEIQPEDDGMVASVFSGSSVFVVMALGLFGLLVSRKLRSRQVVAAVNDETTSELDDQLLEMTAATDLNNSSSSKSLVKSAPSGGSNGASGSSALSRQPVGRMQVAGPTSLFGAYRIDQEVGKLVYGQAHRIDVLSSRAIDDRRAIEASLIKSVNSPDLDENGQRKAREALEEYGFVARQCAALLLAPDAFERTSAARALGEIRSAASLPFLLEGLYDSEPIVRNQAVMSIGELKLPAAIGALLDIARTHPDVPSGLLSRTLSACSVEGLDFFDAVMPEPSLLGGAHDDIVEQITHLEPTSSVEELPESSDDERLTQALVLVASSDVQERAEALKTLVQFRIKSAVEAMAMVARNDAEPNLRSVAISSLGTINHESVFPSILIGMADEAREVRAASARSLNRLSFDRSEAYVRVIETSDEATINQVAKACIHAGIVSQNLDRLAASDHRQAYETFSLICLLAKARMSQPVLDAISDHANSDVRIKAVHLLACTGQPEIADQLRELAVKDGMREDVKTALLEALYKIEQDHLQDETPESEIQADSDPVPPADEAESPEVTNAFDLAMIPAPALELETPSGDDASTFFEFEPTVEVAALEEVEE
ncbi:MAG TPA: HEAT repeat domain-containing protein [Pyrinomonadaceae bacterium]|nr:HEAT repeat domain-containing protein [Pyrinomonadaceae bacterium]